jgi:hypothetical protein
MQEGMVNEGGRERQLMEEEKSTNQIDEEAGN